MEFGVQMAYAYESVAEAATLGEKWGLSSLTVVDHYLMSYDMETGWDLPAYDALVQLGGLARETSSIEIGTLVTPITFRHPAVLAKSAVTLNEISGGRFKLGLGVRNTLAETMSSPRSRWKETCDKRRTNSRSRSENHDSSRPTRQRSTGLAER